MPNFKTLYGDGAKRLLLLLMLGCFFLTGCGRGNEDRFLFGKSPGEAEDAVFGDASAAPGAADSHAGLQARAADETAFAEEISDTAVQEEEDFPGCIVHICGAVQNPGVYELPAGSRLIDAVEAGGGFLPEADQDACNLAALVTDGCQIYIMTEEESDGEGNGRLKAGIQTAEPSQASGSSYGAEERKVNLNTADADGLKTLPGIGDSRAAAIIAYREEYGQFQRIEDVMKVSGIKQAAFDKIKDRITV